MVLREELDNIKFNLPLELKIAAILSKQEITAVEIEFLNKNLHRIKNIDVFLKI